MKTQAIIFDIDGTVVDSPTQKLPSDEMIQAFNQLKDTYYLCAATGRSWTFAKTVLQPLQLTDPSIISAGTQICNPITGEILWQVLLSDESIKQALEIFKQYNEYKLLYNDISEDEYFNGGIFPEQFNITEPINFLEQAFVPDAIAIEVNEKLKSVDGLTCTMVVSQKPGHRDLHITNSSATKEQAVTELLKMIGLERSNAIAIGDGHNDIHLFNAVDRKVAMGNAVPALKEVADEVIGSVKEDGLVEFLNSLHQ
jgi:Cof subfamily protein (haloacid dehalogenase superfamily)